MIWRTIPLNDLKEHEESTTCECNPRIEFVENGNILVFHNSFDGRELIEEIKSELKSKNKKL